MSTTTHNTSTLRLDLIAGLTAAAVVLPKAMAYATVAGLPVAVGLYTVLTPMIIYALLGSSTVLSVSSTTTLAILTASQLAIVVPNGDPALMLTASATLAALVGLTLILASVIRLGFVANFISLPVLTGFKAGIGLVIVLDQLPKLLGIHIQKQNFFHDLWSLLQALPETSLITLVVALVALGSLTFMEHRWPHSAAPLLIVGLGIAATALLALPAKGVSIVGTIPTGLPKLTIPDLALVQQLWPGALGIALMSFTESIAAARAFAKNDEPALKPNRELLATGCANLAGAFLGAMAAGGGTSQTAVVRSAGAQSQRASIFTALAALATMLLLAPLLGLLPNAVLASVVVIYSIGLIDAKAFMAIRQVRTMEFRWAVAAMFGVLLLGTLNGILVAIVISILGLAYQSARPQVYEIVKKPDADVLRPRSPEHPRDISIPGLLILRPEGRLFFLNAELVGEEIRAEQQQHNPKVLLLDFSRVSDIEYSALDMLRTGIKRAQEQGIELWVADLNPVVLKAAREFGLADLLGKERLYHNTRTAIAAYQRRNQQ